MHSVQTTTYIGKKYLVAHPTSVLACGKQAKKGDVSRGIVPMENEKEDMGTGLCI